MKLTPELLAQSPSFINPLKERQLDLRGYKIPTIENLGVTKDQHDCIDLTDNSVAALANLPLLKRLRTLLLANNRIATISPSLHLSAPNLTTIILTNNNVSELGDLEPLRELRSLKYLSLLGNPVRERKWYREWLVWRLKTLRVLDFQRIRDKERTGARSLFLTPDDLPTSLATTIQSSVTTISSRVAISTDEPRPEVPGKAGRLMTAEEKERVKAAIVNATSAEEVRKLERSLKEGWVP
ncbi:L domain-like protein, partial [Ramaria rubella]